MNVLNLRTGEPFDPLPRLHHREESALQVSSSENSARSRGMLLGAKSFYIGGAKKYTARDYVQNGLVAMWDGIENDGWGTHDSSSTHWTNLATGVDCRCASVTFGNMCASFGINGALSFVNSDFKFGDGYGTIEILLKKYHIGSGASRCTIVTGNSTYDGWGVCDSNGLIVDTKDTSDGYGILYNPEDITLFTLTKSSDASTVCLYKNGVRTNGSFCKKGGRYNRGTANSISVGIHSTSASMFDMYNQRVYSTVLASDDVYHNYTIDKARFNLP